MYVCSCRSVGMVFVGCVLECDVHYMCDVIDGSMECVVVIDCDVDYLQHTWEGVKLITVAWSKSRCTKELLNNIRAIWWSN